MIAKLKIYKILNLILNAFLKIKFKLLVIV